MMTNLFSIFDSNTNNIIELNWLSALTNLIIMPYNYWMMKSRIIFIFNSLFKILNKELKIIFNNKFNFMNSIYFLSLFNLILMNNFMGLFPYIFTCSSHLIFSLFLSIPIWMGLMMFVWLNNTNFMFSHLIPQGTPNLLMPFMVLIETVSNVIRPGTLSIRLTANMIAGHLLITLLSNSAISNYMILSILIIIIQTILLMLEFSVSMIQSYVFTILSSLYTKETN